MTTVTVKAVRPHDTSDGMKQPGDTYTRDAGEAETLRAAGVLSIVADKPKAKAKV